MDDLQEWYERIDDLATQGLLTPDAILKGINQNVLIWCALNEETEVPHLCKTFDSLASEENGTKKLTQSAFLAFLEATGFLPPPLRDAGALVYRSLLYLSQYPLYLSVPEALTYEEFMHALAWLRPCKSRHIYDAGQDSRSRSPADSRRQLFQSFATTRDARSIPFDAVHAKKKAEQRAFDFTGAECAHIRRQFAATNYDDDGDEMFHDILDVLYSVQPKEIGWRSPPRGSFRPVARKLVREERVHHLSIPQSEFRAVVKLLVTTYFGKPRVSVEQLTDLGHVVDCIVRPVIQRPNIGIILDMFDQAVGNGMPLLMESLQRLLGPFYRDPKDNDITVSLPQPGKVATLPVLVQMSSLGIFSWWFISVKPPKYYDVRATTATASALADDLDTFPNAAIALLVSGKNSQTGEKTVFGYYIPDPEFEEVQKFLFQLSLIQDAFRGNNTRSGRELDRGELVFGQKGNGVSMVLQQDLKKAIVSHCISGQHEPMYPSTVWRGDWRVEIKVEDIEVWTEQQPEYDNEDEEKWLYCVLPLLNTSRDAPTDPRLRYAEDYLHSRPPVRGGY